MGFSQQDLLEGQMPVIRLGKIRFGPRFVPRERLNVPYQGVRREMPEKSKRTGKEPKPPPDPGYERYQLRLW